MKHKLMVGNIKKQSKVGANTKVKVLEKYYFLLEGEYWEFR